MRYVDLMDPFAHDTTLCHREFSKFLINKAYTCYDNLKSGPRLGSARIHIQR